MDEHLMSVMVVSGTHGLTVHVVCADDRCECSRARLGYLTAGFTVTDMRRMISAHREHFGQA